MEVWQVVGTDKPLERNKVSEVGVLGLGGLGYVGARDTVLLGAELYCRDQS